MAKLTPEFRALFSNLKIGDVFQARAHRPTGCFDSYVISRVGIEVVLNPGLLYIDEAGFEPYNLAIIIREVVSPLLQLFVGLALKYHQALDRQGNILPELTENMYVFSAEEAEVDAFEFIVCKPEDLPDDEDD